MLQKVLQVGQRLLQVRGGQAVLISQLQGKENTQRVINLKQPPACCLLQLNSYNVRQAGAAANHTDSLHILCVRAALRDERNRSKADILLP